MEGIREALASMEVLRQANPASLAALTPRASLRGLRRGEHLFWDKDEVTQLYFAAEGTFSLYKLNSQGEKKVIFVYGPGQMLNEVILQDLPASINCEALGPARALCFPKEEFLRVMEGDFALTKAVLDSLSTKIRRLYRQLKNTTGSVRGDKRIAAKLWKLAKDHGVPCPEGTRIELELTITYLAEMLGSKRETVSRQMKLLQDEGLILQKNNAFILPDAERLMEYFKAN